jgi:hypothetical protein
MAQHDGRSPEAIAIEEVRGFLHGLITQRRVPFSPNAPGVRPLRVGRQARLHAGAAHLGPAVAAPLPRARPDGRVARCPTAGHRRQAILHGRRLDVGSIGNRPHTLSLLRRETPPRSPPAVARHTSPRARSTAPERALPLGRFLSRKLAMLQPARLNPRTANHPLRVERQSAPAHTLPLPLDAVVPSLSDRGFPTRRQPQRLTRQAAPTQTLEAIAAPPHP